MLLYFPLQSQVLGPERIGIKKIWRSISRGDANFLRRYLREIETSGVLKAGAQRSWVVLYLGNQWGG